jgi:DNA-binding MarR family transcriptional regulator
MTAAAPKPSSAGTARTRSVRVAPSKAARPRRAAAATAADPALDALLDGFDLAFVVSHLLRRAHFRAEEIFNERAGRMGVTPRQKALLIAVYRSPGANQSELAERIALDRNTFAEMLSRMVRAGMLVRDKDPADARSNRIFITAHGIEVLKEIMPIDRDVELAVVEPLPPEYRLLFVKCLRKMVGIDTDG